MTRLEAALLACCEAAHVLRIPALIVFAWCVGYVAGWL